MLIAITSAGIFGYLSNAYQGATIAFEKQSTTLFYKEDRLEQLEEDKVYLKDELEQSIASLPEHDYGKNILDVQKQSSLLIDDKLPNITPVHTVKESLIINGMLPRCCW